MRRYRLARHRPLDNRSLAGRVAAPPLVRRAVTARSGARAVPTNLDPVTDRAMRDLHSFVNTAHLVNVEDVSVTVRTLEVLRGGGCELNSMRGRSRGNGGPRRPGASRSTQGRSGPGTDSGCEILWAPRAMPWLSGGVR